MDFLALPTFTFRQVGVKAMEFQAVPGPEARALHGKSIGGEGIPSGDPPWLPLNGAGRSGARLGAPTAEYFCSQGKNGLPGPRNEAGLMIFPCNALASGPGTA